MRRQDVASLLRHPALKAAREGRARTQRLVSTYFDTDGLHLARAGIALRLRRDANRWVQTVKGPDDGKGGGGLAARPEYEWPVGVRPTRPPVDRARLASTPWRGKFAKALRKGLKPVFTTDFQRTSIPLALPGDTRALLSVDVGAIRAPGAAKSARLCELEIELRTGDVVRSVRSGARARRRCAAGDRNAKQGGARLRPVRRRFRRNPRAPRIAALGKAPTAAAALAAFIRASLRQIDGNADGLLRDDDPEWIHQMRIGTRRLRACLVAAARSCAAGRAVAARRGGEVACAARSAPRAISTCSRRRRCRRSFAGMRSDRGTAAPRRRSGRWRARVGRQRKLAASAGARRGRSPRFVQLVLAAAALAATPRLGVPRRVRRRRAASSQRARKFARPLLEAAASQAPAPRRRRWRRRRPRRATRRASRRKSSATRPNSSPALFPRKRDARLPRGAGAAAGDSRRAERRAVATRPRGADRRRRFAGSRDVRRAGQPRSRRGTRRRAGARMAPLHAMRDRSGRGA